MALLLEIARREVVAGAIEQVAGSTGDAQGVLDGVSEFPVDRGAQGGLEVRDGYLAVLGRGLASPADTRRRRAGAVESTAGMVDP